MMTLTQFHVTNFRSVMDSGWIDCDDITSLIGINEAGKSNLILALWKLKPARIEGESVIDSLHDMPRHIRTACGYGGGLRNKRQTQIIPG